MHRKAYIVSAEANLSYVEGYLTEDEPLLAARREAAEVGGAPPIGPGGGAALRFIAAAISARSVVEIGTGCGTSGIWLLRGMRSDAVLTSVDVEPEHQRLARQGFNEAGVPSNRYRLISGKALDVLPRLTDGAYDLVFCDADKQEYPDYLVAALRLLRAGGGGVACENGLAGGRVADPSRDDPSTSAIRSLNDQVRQDERLVPLLLPGGEGLLTAGKRGGPASRGSGSRVPNPVAPLVFSPSSAAARAAPAMSRWAQARPPVNSRRNSAASMDPARPPVRAPLARPATGDSRASV